MKKLKDPPGIIPAIDMSLGQAITYINKLKGAEGITGLKIGAKIVENYGFIITKRLFKDIGIDFDLIYDKQKGSTDVPFIIKEQVSDAASGGINAYIGSPLGAGSNVDPENQGSLEAFIEACEIHNILPIIVLEMTQPGATTFSSLEKSEDLARRCVNLGIKYFVAPATKPKRIEIYKKIIGHHAEIISPGIGPQKTGNAVEDAVNAIKAGADHLVIGRAIYKSEDPKSIIKELYQKIQENYNR